MPRGTNYRYVCEMCGETVERYVRPYRLATFGPPKYCSNECRALAKAGLPRDGSPKQVIQCEVCESPFEVIGSVKGRKYCSADCQHLSMTSPDGTRRGDDLGYWHVKVTGHPYARNGGHWILEHRLMMEQMLRRDDPGSEFLLDGYLHPDCHVHHINGDRGNNVECNLQPLWPSDHQKLQKGEPKLPCNTEFVKRCWLCGEVMPRDRFGKNSAAHDGLDGKCRECNTIYIRFNRGKLNGSENPEIVNRLADRKQKR